MMDAMQAGGRRHRLLCAHMLLAAALFSLQHTVGYWINHGSYTPFSVSPSVSSLTLDETFAYAPQARRFMSTGGFYPETDNYELKSLHAAMPFGPVAILGAMGRVSGSLEAAFVAADVLFPPILLLLFYALSGGIVRGCTARLLIAWSTLLIPFAPRGFLGLGPDGSGGLLEITRTPQPEVSILFLLIAVFAVARALRTGAGWGTILAATAASAVNIYTYYFYTAGWALTLAALFCAALLWHMRQLAVRTAAIGTGTALLGIPFVFVTWKGNAEIGQQRFLSQFGPATHAPDLPALATALVGFCILAAFGRRLFTHNEATLRMGLLCFSAIAGLLGLNLQVISGRELQSLHFLFRLVDPVVFFLACCALLAAWQRRGVPACERTGRVAAVALAVLLLFAAARQITAASQAAGYQRSDSATIELLSWIRSNLPADRVIGTGDHQLAMLIPAIVPDFVYVPFEGRTLSSAPEIAARRLELKALLDGSLSRSVPLRGRLDYLILNAGQREFPNLQAHFPKAHIVYRNLQYSLAECVPAGTVP